VIIKAVLLLLWESAATYVYITEPCGQYCN